MAISPIRNGATEVIDLDITDEKQAVVSTPSKFHDPREAVGRMIAEALDPVRAPKTVRVWFRDPPPSRPTHAPDRPPPSPELQAILDRTNTKAVRMDAIRAARDRALERRDPRRSMAEGITSEVETEPASHTTASVRERNDARAVPFLRRWLARGPAQIADIRADAEREEIPWSSVRRAAKTLGCARLWRGQVGGDTAHRYWMWRLPDGAPVAIAEEAAKPETAEDQARDVDAEDEDPSTWEDSDLDGDYLESTAETAD